MTWREPARDLPVIGSPDVLVVGAGSAGVAAAIAAARRGADTWLVERLSYVGGLATGGLINLLLTLDDGHGDQVVRGLCQELVDILDTRGAARYPPRRVGKYRRRAGRAVATVGSHLGCTPDVVRYSVAFDPEDFIDVAYENLSAAGVRLRLHSWCVAVHAPEGCVEAVVLESKAGRQVVRPRVVIDTTGDGDVLAGAGARHESVKVHPYLWFRLGGAHDLADDRGWSDGIFFRTTAPGRVLVPWGGPGAVDDKIDPLDPDELTRAELECRRDAMREAERLRAEVPELADAWRDDVAKQLGITESRRLVGDFVLEKDHGDVGFPDSVARTGHWTKRGVVYDIPYRCLTTPVVSNLLTAGRCISVSRYVHQATKEIPAAMATGEAAGAAAVHSLDVGGDVRTVDVDALRRDLYGNGAVVGGPVVDRTEAEPG